MVCFYPWENSGKEIVWPILWQHSLNVNPGVYFTLIAASHRPSQPLESSAQTCSSLYPLWGETWSRRDEEREEGLQKKQNTIKPMNKTR